MITDLLIIALICTYCISVSGFIDSMDEILQKLSKNPFYHIPRPFSCPKCATFWCGLIYLLVTHQFTLPGIALACIASWSTELIEPLMHLIKDMFTRAVDALYNYFQL